VKALILASSSPYRAALLTRLGLGFETRSPDIDETRLDGESPEGLVERLARSKAQAVAPAHPGALVIGSDQVAVCGSDVLGKPETAPRARDQLALLSGHSVTFFTGLCLLDTTSGDIQTAVVPTRVQFRHLSAREIDHYVARDRPLDCAGAFRSEGLGIALFDAIEGDDPNALIGLPLIALCRMLRHAGMDVLS
jgi:septum formation protein